MISALLKLASANPALAPWVTPLQALWPLLWRLALLGTFFGLGWHYGGKSAENTLAKQRAQLLQAHIDAVDALRAEERKMDELSTQVETDYEAAKVELAELRQRIPTRVVRVCDETTDHRGMPVSRGPTKSDGTTAKEELPRAFGRDIGPALYSLADECDEIAARIVALQKWTIAMAAKEDK